MARKVVSKQRKYTYRDMVLKAIKCLGKVDGTTTEAINNYLASKFKIRNEFVVMHTLNRLVLYDVLGKSRGRYKIKKLIFSAKVRKNKKPLPRRRRRSKRLLKKKRKNQKRRMRKTVHRRRRRPAIAPAVQTVSQTDGLENQETRTEETESVASSEESLTQNIVASPTPVETESE